MVSVAVSNGNPIPLTLPLRREEYVFSVRSVASSAAAMFPLQKHRNSTKSRPRSNRLRPRTSALRKTCTEEREQSAADSVARERQADTALACAERQPRILPLPEGEYVFSGGRDSALRCPRRVERRLNRAASDLRVNAFRPLDAGGDAAARRPYRLALETLNTYEG